MDIATTISLVALGLIVLFGLGIFGLFSIWEGERRAAWLALGAAVVFSLPLFLSALLPVGARLAILGVIGVAGPLGVVLFLLPIGRVEHGRDVPRGRFDERDIMFARARLVPGSPQYEVYYKMRPDNQAGDDKTRALPGLLSLDAREAVPLAFASAEASFSLTEALREEVDGPLSPARSEYPAGQMTSYIKGLARYYGAYTVGIAELRPYHVYSHIGRGSGEYGAPITLDHRYAIAFTVEMDHAIRGGQGRPAIGLFDTRAGIPGPRAHRWQLPRHRAAGGSRRRPGRDRSYGVVDDARAGSSGAPGGGDHRSAIGPRPTERRSIGPRLLSNLQEVRRKLSQPIHPLG
jgi:hypothetical protein